MQLLPLELQLFIVELSSGSPSSLAALSRTHPAYQRVAERALYETLTIYASRDYSLKCMGILVYIYARDCDDSLKCIATLANKFRESCSTSPFSDCQIFVQKHQEEPESDDLSVKMPKLICTLSL